MIETGLYRYSPVLYSGVFVRERGFLVLTGIVLGDSCTTSIKYFAIFPTYPKNTPKGDINCLTLRRRNEKNEVIKWQ